MYRVVSVSLETFKKLPCTVLRLCDDKTTDEGKVHLSFPEKKVEKKGKHILFDIGGRGKRYPLHTKHVLETNWE